MQKVSIAERIYNRVETLIMDKLVGQENPGPVFKWIFKIPILQYKLGLGWMIGQSMRLWKAIFMPRASFCPCR